MAFTPKKAAVIIKQVLESAIANAEHNDGADIDELKVTEVLMPEKKAQLIRILENLKEYDNPVIYDSNLKIE